MRRWIRIVSLAGTMLLVAVVVSEVAPGATADLGRVRLVAETNAAPAEGDVIGLRFAGRVASQSPDAAHMSWTGDLRSLATNEVVGTLTHVITCNGAISFPCGVFESVDTFELPGGTIVNQAMESVAPDISQPGMFHVGIHPEGNSIVSGTGIYAGRTGRAHMSARHDGREYPEYVTFDDFWLIELDPKS